MSRLFRSEDMTYVRLTMTREATYDTINELASMGKLHVVDLNADAVAFSETYLHYKKRAVFCDQLERRLRGLEDDAKKHDIPVPNLGTTELSEYKGADVLASITNDLEPIEAELARNIEFKVMQTRELNELTERAMVLENSGNAIAAPRLEAERAGPAPASKAVELGVIENKSLLNRADLQVGLLSSEVRGAANAHHPPEEREERAQFHRCLLGTIPVVQQVPFERMIFRATRGNAYVKFSDASKDLRDPTTNEPILKSVFAVFYVGSAIQKRVTRLCEFFQAHIYAVPDNSRDVATELKEVEEHIRDKDDVLLRTTIKIKELYASLAVDRANGRVSPLRNYGEWIRRERLVCDVLKRCELRDDSQLIKAEGWIPVEDLSSLNLAVRQAVKYSGAQPAVVQRVGTLKPPPTYFKTNKFTSVFQGIVNTYGVPRYHEVNPGLFTCASFPFLFGIMYGDLGHGSLLFLASLTVVLLEDRLEQLRRRRELGELPSMIYGGRYLLLMMGFFALYCGTLYNDTFSIPIDAFGSTWHFPNATSGTGESDGRVYPYGVDPGWYNTRNELTFFNSLKMKLSVIFGVTHMTFGIILSAFNHIYFRDYLSLFLEFVPQLLFMMSTFGYMIFIIIFKMTVDWSSSKFQPPNLIQTMIKMFLSPGSVASDLQLYEGQGAVQGVLILFAVVAIPWMLCAKPFVLKSRHEKQQLLKHSSMSAAVPSGDHSPRSDSGVGHNPPSGEVLMSVDDEKVSSSDSPDHSHGGGGGHGHGHGEFVFSEVFIHQAIHTIEFVLGSVSNTASYLRLWALSLAHAELSNVFWNKLIMQYGVQGGAFMAFVGFGGWAGATFAVLMAMDVLECFLHALRLHWVEFQNKFFAADGYLYVPFTFEEKIEDS